MTPDPTPGSNPSPDPGSKGTEGSPSTITLRALEGEPLAAVLLVANQAHRNWERSCLLANELGSAVRAAVVNHDDFRPVVALAEIAGHGLERRCDARRLVEGGHDEGEKHLRSGAAGFDGNSRRHQQEGKPR